MFLDFDTSGSETAPAPASRSGLFRAFAQAVKSRRLGDLLIASGLINPLHLRTALLEQEKTGEKLGKILIRQGAITTVQLYQKLSEQWCIKASAAGITVLMQTVVPSPGWANELSDNVKDVTAARFMTASANVPSSRKHASAPRQYPELFGTREIRSNDISAFRKWTDVMERFEDQMKTRAASSPRVMMWKAQIQELKGKSSKEQIDGINDFLNKVPYVEDIDNYGKSDYWATPGEFLSRGGDCEDFAIAKYASLRALGFSTDQLRVAIVQDTFKNIAHAVLIVYSDSGNFVLDNQDKKVEAIASVTRYQPIFSINSTSWWLHRA
ncbi:MAG: transglutaminase-like cysteine peptidase [Pseudomonadota bacterium]